MTIAFFLFTKNALAFYKCKTNTGAISYQQSPCAKKDSELKLKSASLTGKVRLKKEQLDLSHKRQKATVSWEYPANWSNIEKLKKEEQVERGYRLSTKVRNRFYLHSRKPWDGIKLDVTIQSSIFRPRYISSKPLNQQEKTDRINRRLNKFLNTYKKLSRSKTYTKHHVIEKIWQEGARGFIVERQYNPAVVQVKFEKKHKMMHVTNAILVKNNGLVVEIRLSSNKKGGTNYNSAIKLLKHGVRLINYETIWESTNL